MNINIVILAFIALSGMTSCADEKKKEVEVIEVEETQQNPTDAQKDQVVLKEAKVDFENEGTEMVFQSYLEVKNALVATDAVKAKEAARKLNESLKDISAEDSALKASEAIANTEDINKQREAFSPLSAEIEKLIEGSVSSGAVYQQYCPMAFEGKGGYWLSTSKEIRNPYYGTKMLKCGSVEKTFE
ncbi:MAG TPA: DUF3347 domain-containing protein [Salinimicrobium sp.]|nr:DUF3347 domain-containing protein [Salinimicrobium sp.]